MNSKEIIESGLLELYILGTLEGSEHDMVVSALLSDQFLRDELEKIEETLFYYAQANAITPNPIVKPLLMAKIDYLERVRAGEAQIELPILNENSSVEYFDRWLNREDMQLNPDFDQVQINILSEEPDKVTAIVWLKSGAPPESHGWEQEKFLIVEGTCDITIGMDVYSLVAGDYLSIPLHISHHVTVTSEVPCKIILQRVKVHNASGY